MMTSHDDVDGGWAWCVLGACFCCQLMCSGLAFVAGVFQVIFLREFQGSVALTSWVTGLFSALLQLAGPVSSVVANTSSCRTSVMVGGALLAVGFFISGMMDSLQGLMVSFGAVAGMGMGMIYTPSFVITSFFFHKRRNLANGIATSGGGLGIILAPQISQLLLDNFSWREALFILAGISIHICIAGALMFPIFENTGKNGFNKCCCRKGSVKLCPCEKSMGGQKGDCEDKNSCVCGVDLENEIVVNHNDVNSPVKKSNEDCASMTGYGDPLLKSNREDIEMDNRTKEQVFGIRQINSLLSKSHERFHHLVPPHEKQNRTNQFSSVSHSELNAVGVSQHIKDMHKSDTDVFKQMKDLKIHDISNSCSLHNSGSRSCKLMIISNTPSMSSLISSAHHLKIVVSPNTNADDDNDRSANEKGSNNFLEQKIILEAEESELNKRENGVFHSSLNLKHKYPPLYKNELFLMLCVVLFFHSAGSGCFLIHVPAFLQAQGMSEWEVINILSINGVAILVGRCLLGALVNSVPGSEELFFISMQIIGGLFMLLFPILGTSYASCMGIMFATAAYCGTVYSLLPVLTILYAGLASLTTALGIEMVCCGVGFLIAPPLGGLAVDITGNYDINAYGGGVIFVLAGLIAMALPGMSGRRE